MAAAAAMADENSWSNLLPDILGLIAKRLKFPDYISFRCVCASWRSAAAERPLLPLLVSCTVDAKSSISTFNFLSFTGDADLVPIESQQLSNLAPNKLICGSSHGWLALVDSTARVTLINPFTNSQILLPPYPQSLLREVHLWCRQNLVELLYMEIKIVLSADPSVDPNFLVIQMGRVYSTGLMFWRRGDDSWRTIEHDGSDFYGDALFYGGHIVYAIKNNVVTYNIERNHLSIRRGFHVAKNDTGKRFLVESAGDLLFVRQLACSFQVFKVVLGEDTIEEVESLGDHALFIGDNLAISVRASECPGCKANSIYYALDGGKPLRVSLEDGISESISGHLDQIFRYGTLTTALWLKPNLSPGPAPLT